MKFSTKEQLYLIEKTEMLFAIFRMDDTTRKYLEQTHGLKMNHMEWAFLEDQRNDRKMYCEDFVNRKWTKTMEHGTSDLQCLEKMREEMVKEIETSRLVASFENS